MKIRITVLISLLIILTLPMLGVHAGGVVAICDEASLDAALAGGGTVTFSCSGTITITSTKVISADTTIDGTGQTVTISGGGTVRVFEVNTGVILDIASLTIANGFASDVGGGILNNGTVNLSDSALTGNSVVGGGGGGAILNYGAANVFNTNFSNNSVNGAPGGALYNVGGTVSISNSSFSNNSTSGSSGGAIYNNAATQPGQFTVTNTTFTGNSVSGGDGGAILNNDSIANISGSTFANNSSSNQGGAILNGGGLGTATLTITNSTFSGNTAAVLGGAIHNGCVIGSCISGISGNATITNSTFSSNSAPTGGAIANNAGMVDVITTNFSSNTANTNNVAINYGGAIYNDAGDVFNVSASTFSSNHAFAGGGGIYNNGGTVNVSNNTTFSSNNVSFHGAGIRSNGGTLNVSNATFTGNFTGVGGFVGFGAGIFNEGGTATLTDSTFSNNTASNSGGAIVNTGLFTITGSTFVGNVGNNQGGGNGSGAVENVGTLVISNSTFTNNSTGTQGGAIRNAAASTIDVTNTTFSGNSAPSGGVIFQVAGGTATFRNTIIANSPSGGNCAGDPIIDGGNNLQFPGTTCGGSIPSADPLLGPLADNGGPTETMALDSASPAIDAGSNTVCAASPVNNLDQRGVSRPLDGDGDSSAVCDVGAFEAPALGNAVSDFVVLGHEGIHLQQNSVVNSGDVGANDASSGPFLAEGSEVTIGIGVDILDPASRVMGDTVTVKQGAQIYDVYYNEISGNGQILGQQFTPVDLPLVDSFPTVPTFTPGTQDFDVAQNGSLTLNAGSYGTLLARLNSTITFTGGVYDFAEWDVRDSVDLLFEAPSEIRIAGKLSVDQGSFVGPSPTATGLGASDIVIFVTGQNGSNGNLGATPKAAKFGINSTVIANVYAPNGTLWLRQGTVATGAFLGRWVDIGIGVELTLDSGFGGGGFALMAASAECSLNPGFWLANPNHAAWSQLSDGTGTAFLTSGVTYQEVLSAPDSPYYTLAQSYVAAELALLNGANPFNANGDDVRQTLRYAYNVLSSAQGDQLSPEYDSDAQRLANQLNRYLSSLSCLS